MHGRSAPGDAPRRRIERRLPDAMTIAYEYRHLSVQIGVRSSEMKLVLVILLTGSSAFAVPSR